MKYTTKIVDADPYIIKLWGNHGNMRGSSWAGTGEHSPLDNRKAIGLHRITSTDPPGKSQSFSAGVQ